MTLAKRALEFATERHFGQTRKYTHEPYIGHIIAVMGILQEWGYEENEAIMAAAALHDTVEDTQCSLAIIREQFGDDVAELVFWLTDLKEPVLASNRKTRTLMAAWRLARAPWEAQVIKLADIADNTKNILQYDADFAKVYLPEKSKLIDMMIKHTTEFRVLCLMDKVRATL